MQRKNKECGFMLVTLSLTISIMFLVLALTSRLQIARSSLEKKRQFSTIQLLGDAGAALFGLSRVKSGSNPGDPNRPYADMNFNGIPDAPNTAGYLPYQIIKVPPKDEKNQFFLYDATIGTASARVSLQQ